MFDLLIRNGIITDGTGNPWFRGSIGVKGGRILQVGMVKGDTSRVIDAEGLLVSPGFIDTHSHSDFVYLADPTATFKLLQGVTTEVVGNCGFSPIPVPTRKNYLKILEDYTGQISGGFHEFSWTNLRGFAKVQRQRGMSTNLLVLVGHGNLRIASMGMDDRPPKRQELSNMKSLLEHAMRSGAVGMSTGLMYPPGFYSQIPEIAELARVVARNGGLITSHIRNYAGGLEQSVEELIEVGRRAHIPVHLSHITAALEPNWGKMTKVLELVDQARAEGIDVTMDRYPYTAANTTLRSILPPWMQEGGIPKLIERLKDPATRVKCTEQMEPYNWDTTHVFSCNVHKNWNGKSVIEIAQIWKKSVPDTIYDLLLEERARPTIILFIHSEDDMLEAFKHPSVMVGSDSGPGGAGSHPRSYGSFPRILRLLVIEKKLLRLEEAIQRMTSLPAQRFGLSGRGLIRTGMMADLVLFDPESVRDRATYADPCLPPQGIEYVFVNGKIAVEKSIPLETAHGHLLLHRKTTV